MEELESKAQKNLHELKTSFPVAGRFPKSRESSSQHTPGRFWKSGDEMQEKRHDLSNLSNCSTAFKSNDALDNKLNTGFAGRRYSGFEPNSPNGNMNFQTMHQTEGLGSLAPRGDIGRKFVTSLPRV